jgi:hypothetical protein
MRRIDHASAERREFLREGAGWGRQQQRREQ